MSASPEIEPYAILGGGVGEGLAAVCGHQSGAQGMRVAISAPSSARYYMTGHRYKGHPFGYSGFLEKIVRPICLRAMRYGGQANMDRRRPVAVLPYSEL